MEITKTWLDSIEVNIDKTLQEKLSSAAFMEVLKNTDLLSLKDNNYSIVVDDTYASDQKKSNYCWMHACFNIIKHNIKRKTGIDNINFSFSYLAFYDKLERFNLCMNNLVKYRHKKEWKYQVRDNLKMFDNGSLTYFRKLASKYGVVITESKEPFIVDNTRNINYLLELILRGFDKKMRLLNDSDIDVLKEQTLQRVYQLLITFFNPPKENFMFLNKEWNATEFYNKYAKKDLGNLVCIINYPELKYDNLYYSNKRKYPFPCRINELNLEISKYKEVILNQIKKGELLYTSICAFLNFDNQLMLYDEYLCDDSKLGFDFSYDKNDAIKYAFGKPNHAVCISGVDLDKDNNIIKWKFKNSVGNKINKGHNIVSKEWFDNHCFLVYVNKKYLSEEILELYKKKPINSDNLYK